MQVSPEQGVRYTGVSLAGCPLCMCLLSWVSAMQMSPKQGVRYVGVFILGCQIYAVVSLAWCPQNAL